MASKAATLGDPRRPEAVKKVTAVTMPASDDSTSSFILIAAMGVGIAGFMFQSKLAVWAGLFLTMAAYAHMPFDAPNSAQLSMFVLTMVMWAAVQVYFRPLLMPRQAQPSAAAAADD